MHNLIKLLEAARKTATTFQSNKWGAVCLLMFTALVATMALMPALVSKAIAGS